jgi:hypothetical protein
MLLADGDADRMVANGIQLVTKTQRSEFMVCLERLLAELPSAELNGVVNRWRIDGHFRKRESEMFLRTVLKAL